jgi:hypothetical protein
MIIRFTVFIFGIAIVACGGSPTSPSSVGLVVTVGGGDASLVRQPNGPSVISYRACYDIRPPSGGITTATISRVVFTVFGPTGAVYHQGSDPFGSYFGGQVLGVNGSLGIVGCPTWFNDEDLSRPTATRYELRVDYTVQSESGRVSGVVSASATGEFVSRVPDHPLMTGITLTLNGTSVGGSSGSVRIGIPATFVATGAAGVPPYQFRWTFNGFILRDWDSNDTLTWDGTALGGRPLQPTIGTLVVQGRSSVGTNPEAGTSVNLNVRQ